MASKPEVPATVAPALAAPVAEPAPEIQKRKPNNRKAGKQRDPNAVHQKIEAPQVDPSALRPKHVSKTNTAERNDPLISNSDPIYDGAMGFTEIRQSLEFHMDFTGYVGLIAVSYEKMIQLIAQSQNTCLHPCTRIIASFCCGVDSLK